MKNLFKIITANLYKITHSMLIWVHIIIPIIGALGLSWYLGYQDKDGFSNLFDCACIIALIFPVMIGIVTAMLFEQDKNAGKFQNILSVPCSRTVSHTGNIVALMICGLASSLLTVGGFGIVNMLMGKTTAPIKEYFIIALIVFIPNIAMYVLQYIVCYCLGKGVSIGLGIFNFIIASTMEYGQWDNVWKFAPCSYANRILRVEYSKRLLVNMGKNVKEIISKQFPSYSLDLLVVGIITVLIIVCFYIWSTRWEGCLSTDE